MFKRKVACLIVFSTLVLTGCASIDKEIEDYSQIVEFIDYQMVENEKGLEGLNKLAMTKLGQNSEVLKENVTLLKKALDFSFNKLSDVESLLTKLEKKRLTQDQRANINKLKDRISSIRKSHNR